MQKRSLSLVALTALLGAPVLAQEAQDQGQSGADIQVQQPAPDIQVQQPAPQVTVDQPQPQVTIEQPQPEVTVQQPQPEVTVEQPQPEVTVEQAKPDVEVEQQGQADVRVTQPGQADVEVEQSGQQPDDQASTAAQPADQAGDTIDQQATANDNPIYGMTGAEIVGQTIYGANGEEIGEIDNVVMGRGADTNPAAIVGVGGFLGLGERDVAVPLDRMRKEGDRLTTDLTREQIGDMQAYDESAYESWDPNRSFDEAMNR
jgi:outer membrane biosynthesis protein TonB